MSGLINIGCYFHGHEPMPIDCFRICFECKHAWSAEELLDAHNSILREIATADGWLSDLPRDVTDPDQVTICPLCTHDF